MTITKLIDEYNRLLKEGYETLTINEAIKGLRQLQLRAVRKFIIKGDKNGKEK